ncbi:retrovirus-related pol polyprotein from transposon TNT 1-94 [Tanacetum coccineum]
MDMTIIGTKWIYKNKLDENGIVTRNKARLVAQGYNQQEGINYDETYAPVARLESIRILLAYACALDFKLYQMDVKSAFLNGFINDEFYVAQLLRFIDFAKPNYVYRLKKAPYGLKQAPKAWYNRLKAFLIKHDYSMGMVDNTLFTKKKDSNLIIVQIYVDDIIFGSTCQEMCDDFAKIMHDEMFLSQKKYDVEILEPAYMANCNPSRTPDDIESKLGDDGDLVSDPTLYRSLEGYVRGTLDYELQLFSSSTTSLVAYSDADWASFPTNRRSTSGYCMFLGNNLLFWSAKRQPTLSPSSAEAEYHGFANVVAETCWLTISPNVEVSFFKLLRTTDDVEDMTFDVYALPCFGLVLFIQRISLTGFPAQSVGSSNTDVLDSPCLLVLIIGTSQSRQHAEFDKEERLVREKAEKEEEANIALIETWDDI